MKNKVMRVLICGSRGFNEDAYYQQPNIRLWELCDACIMQMLKSKIESGCSIEIVEGEAVGADKYAKGFASRYGFTLKGFPANWARDGRGAGYIRNRVMFDYISEVQNNAVIVLWDGSSKGTKNDLALTDEYNVQTRVFLYNEMRWLSQDEIAETICEIESEALFK